MVAAQWGAQEGCCPLISQGDTTEGHQIVGWGGNLEVAGT